MTKLAGLESLSDELDNLENEHQFDAFVCALVARAAQQGLTLSPSPEQEALASREGWIHVPRQDSLPELIRG